MKKELTSAEKSRVTKLSKKSNEELVNIIIRKDDVERRKDKLIACLKTNISGLENKISNIQEDLRNAANALQVVKIKHQWKNGVVATYEMALLGWSVSEGTVDDLMKFTISGKRNGDVAWSEAEQQV